MTESEKIAKEIRDKLFKSLEILFDSIENKIIIANKDQMEEEDFNHIFN